MSTQTEALLLPATAVHFLLQRQKQTDKAKNKAESLFLRSFLNETVESHHPTCLNCGTKIIGHEIFSTLKIEDFYKFCYSKSLLLQYEYQRFNLGGGNLEGNLEGSLGGFCHFCPWNVYRHTSTIFLKRRQFKSGLCRLSHDTFFSCSCPD